MTSQDGIGRVMSAAWTAIAVAVALAGVAATAATVDHPSDNVYATPQFFIGLSSVAVGATVAWRRPRHPAGWLLLLAGTGAWLSFAGSAVLAWMVVNAPERQDLGRVLLHLSVPGWILTRGVFFALLPQAFPDGFGRSLPARALQVVSATAISVTVVAHSRLFTFEQFMGQPPTGTAVLAEQVLPWGHRAIFACGVLSIVGLVVRTARADAADRARSRWFVAATTVLLLPVLNQSWQSLNESWSLDLSGVEVWTMAALPVVLGVGILRHGLFDLELVLRRATVLSLVSAVALAVYAISVWVVSTVTEPGSRLGPLVGAGVVAVTLSQVRDAVRRAVARRLFGRRDDPYAALAALGERVEAAPLGGQALQTVTDTICEQLRVPYAAVVITLDDTEVLAAETGPHTDAIETFPLTHQGIALGELVVARRTPGEAFTAAERRLLTDLARQTGVLAHNASLTEALRHSRAVLLNAREEERRRIRADLHDGLGPTLATVALGLGAAADRLDDEPELTVLLTDLESELQTAIADVRTLVYDLRPAALDDLGLVSALREHAEQLARRTAGSSRPLSVDIEAPDDLRQLPAGVEVAAYRVALEALTNVARHARASWCRVRLDTARGLTLTVEDDGIGLPDQTTTGVGLTSMRERCEELGGRLRIGTAGDRGTELRAWFPLPAGAGT